MTDCPDDYWEDPDLDPHLDPDPGEPELPPRDSMVDQAKEELAAFFESQPERVYYERQIQIKFEATYFHWIVGKALSELAGEGTISSESRSP